MKKKRLCDKYYAAMELGYILRKCISNNDEKKSGWIEQRYIRNRDGQLCQISRCPFCGKRHW